MAYAPTLDATLLRHHVKFDNDDGTYQVQEHYYEPSDRQAHLLALPQSADGQEYNLATTVLVDSWCEDPGQPPYRQIRVFHNGTGGLTLTPVENVAACELRCTLALAVTPTAVVDGHAYLDVVVSGAQGEVRLSLDDFQTAGLTPSAAGAYEFGPLRTGVYTVYARETRAGGCRAQQTVTLTAAYAPRYQHTFKDKDNAACELLIYQREYTGEVEVLPYTQAAPVVLDWPAGVSDHLFTTLLRGSECQLGLRLTRLDQFLPLYSGDERLHRVHVSRAGAEVWRGYLLPEQYDVAFLSPPSEFNLSATDGLGTLSSLPFAGSAGELLRGDWRTLDVLLFVLGKLELGLPLHAHLNLYPGGANPAYPALEQLRQDVAAYQDEKGQPYDCAQVLQNLLTAFQARLYQWAGAWWLERLSELSLQPLTYQRWAPDGSRLPDVSSSPLTEVLRATDGRPFWIGAAQRQGLRPAVARVSVASAPGEPVNLLAFAQPRNLDLPAAAPFDWNSHSAGAPNVAFSQLVYQGKDKAPLLRLVGQAGPASGYADSAAQNAALRAQPFLETPPTPALPLPFGKTAGHYDETLVLSFQVKAYGFTPDKSDPPAATKRAFMAVALRYGSAWLANSLSLPESTTTPYLMGVELNDSAEITVRLTGFGSLQNTNQPVVLRFYAPVGSPTAATVDISELRLVYEGTDVAAAENYTNQYENETGVLVSRQDKDLTLFHADTPYLRCAGTLLDLAGQPVHGWAEGGAPGQVRELGDYLVAARALWQRAPAQALTGRLRGVLPQGLGTLLTDAAEQRPAVYVLGPATYQLALNEWQVTGVQTAFLLAPGAEVPADAIYNEDDSAWLDEAGAYLVYENG